MSFSIESVSPNRWEVGSGPPMGGHDQKHQEFIDGDSSDAISLRWKELIQDEILDIAAECSAEGWDGDQALPISPEAVRRAFNLIYLSPDWIRPPEIVPSTDGEISFEWRAGRNKLLSLLPQGDEVVFASVLGSTKDREMGYKPLSKGWPESVLRILLEHFPNVKR